MYTHTVPQALLYITWLQVLERTFLKASPFGFLSTLPFEYSVGAGFFPGGAAQCRLPLVVSLARGRSRRRLGSARGSRCSRGVSGQRPPLPRRRVSILLGNSLLFLIKMASLLVNPSLRDTKYICPSRPKAKCRVFP